MKSPITFIKNAILDNKNRGVDRPITKETSSREALKRAGNPPKK